MAVKKKYLKTKVVVWQEHFNPNTKIYSGDVETRFYDTLPFTLEVYEKPEKKERDWGEWVVVWQLGIANKKIGIRERESNYGKQYAGTIIKWEFFVNLDQVLSRGEIKSYEVTFVEREFWWDEEAQEDLPF